MHTSLTIKTVSFDLTNPELIRDPYQYYKTIRETSPVFLSAPDNIYFLTRYTDICYALKTPTIFSSKGTANILQPAWLYDRGIKDYPIVFEDLPRHTIQRQVIARAFTPKAADRLALFIQQLVEELISTIPPSSEIEFVTTFAQPLVDRTIFHHFGIDYNDDRAVLFREWAGLIEDPPLVESVAHKDRLDQLNTLVSSFIDSTIESRQQSMGPDLVSDVVQHTGLSLRDKSDLLEVLLLAAMQATPHVLSRAVLYLASHETLFQQLANNSALIPDFIEELLRYDPPVHLVARRTLEDTEVSGITLPKGVNIILITASANRDSSRFMNPDSFDLHRTDHKHLAFSHGIHHCIGHAVARKILTISLEALLSRFKNFNCPPRETLDWFYSYSVYGFRALPVMFK